MKEIYIKVNDLEEYDYNLLRRVTDKDLVSIDYLLCIIDDLLNEINHLEEQIEELKEPKEYMEDYSNTFDYSEWKANQE